MHRSVFEPHYEKTGFCICENKDADQLRSYCAADQRLCFRYTDSKIPLLPKSEISSLSPSSVAVQPGLCRTWSETPKTDFLTTRLTLIREQSYIVLLRNFIGFHVSVNGIVLVGAEIASLASIRLAGICSECN